MIKFGLLLVIKITGAVIVRETTVTARLLPISGQSC